MTPSNLLYPRVSLSTLNDVWSVAIYTCREDLKTICLQCMSKNFRRFIYHPLLVHLDVESLGTLLHFVDAFDVGFDIDQLTAVSNWIQVKGYRDRLQYSNDLFKNIYWRRISKGFLTQQLGLDSVLANHHPVR